MALSLDRHLDEAMAPAKYPGDGFTGREVADVVGATYRQLDYWCRIGVFESSIASARGSGSRRRFSEADVEVAFVLVDLFAHRIDAGQIGRVAELVRARRVDPQGEWLLVPQNGAPVRSRTLGAPDGLPTPSLLLRLRSFVISPAGTSLPSAGDQSRGVA